MLILIPGLLYLYDSEDSLNDVGLNVLYFKEVFKHECKPQISIYLLQVYGDRYCKSLFTRQ